LSRLAFPYRVECIKGDDQKNAITLAEERKAHLNSDPSKPDFQIFGPYITPDDNYNIVDHDEVEIIFKKKNGEGLEKTIVKSFSIEGKIDAVVFNLSSFDKFFLPYYTRLYGVVRAGTFRESVQSNLAAGKPPSHGGCTYLSDVEQ
jgi:hypothetical protein